MRICLISPFFSSGDLSCLVVNSFILSVQFNLSCFLLSSVMLFLQLAITFWLLLFGGDFTHCRFQKILPFKLFLLCLTSQCPATESRSLLCSVYLSADLFTLNIKTLILFVLPKYLYSSVIILSPVSIA